MADLVGKRLGQYEILSVLGQGGMAIVYKARQESMDRDVAIKVIGGQLVDNPDFVARFQREARLIAKLQHPHILPVYDFGKEETLLFLVMRLVEGGSLDDRLRRGALPIEQAARVFTQIASALTYAHDQGIVHRDLKPNNILLDTKDNPYLTDFGIAKLMEDGGASGRITATGTVMGTPSYMAPEQWRGESIDARTDIYALGVMLYEMLTGDLPFKGDTPYALMYKHFDAQPPSPRLIKPDLPEAVTKVLAKALAKDRDQRYASADLMAQDLNAALAGRAVHADIAMDNEPTFIGDAPQAPTKQGSPTRRQDDARPTAIGLTGSVPADTMPTSKGRLPLIAAVGAIVLLIVGGGLFLASRSGSNIDANATATQAALAALPTHTPTATSTITPTSAPTASPTSSLPTAVRFEDYSDQQLNIKFRTPAGWEVQKKESYSLFVTQDFSKLVFGTANNNPIVTGPPYMQIVVANSQALGALAMADAKTPMDAITAYYGTEQLANLDPVYGTHFPTATTTRTKPDLGVVRYIYMLLLGPDRFALVMVQAPPDQIEAINKNITLPLVRSVDFAVTPTQAPSVTPTATLSGTAQFEMPTVFEKYESATQNFSVTYPSGWQLSESKGIILISSGPGISITNIDSPPYISIFTKTKADLQNYRPEMSMIDIFREHMGFLSSEGTQINDAPYPSVIGRSLGQTQMKINGWVALVQLDQDHYLEIYAQAPRTLEEAYRDKVIIPMIKSINYHPKS